MRHRIGNVREDSGIPFRHNEDNRGSMPSGGQSHWSAEALSSSDNTMRQRIEWFTADLKEIDRFYNITISATRKDRLRKFYHEQLTGLEDLRFDTLNQDGKVDYLLLRNLIERRQRQLDLDHAKDEAAEPLLTFAGPLIALCEDRQQMKPIDAKKAAEELTQTRKKIQRMTESVSSKELDVAVSDAFRAANMIDQFHTCLTEWYYFYEGYNPMFTWWVSEPFKKIASELQELAKTIRINLVGLKEGDEDTIVGEPIGRDGLTAEIEAEKIPYSPEELIQIGDSEYAWCEAEMKKASRELGYGDDWHKALEYVKDLYVDPGEQTNLVHTLAREAIDYVKHYDMITVPPVAEETWRMFMMSPERQKVNPFFLGGDSIIVSYPTDTMDHEDKMMSMRGNNIHFSRSTVFHELIPGHHLQMYSKARHHPYRNIFSTPFWIEGWSLYWEMVLWDDQRFKKTPENRIGMLFWRMHRCARITFSLRFHLGQMSPQECIDYLVDKVGHERATAEGEVRRSFTGAYSPLYQAGYMIGALQFYALRKELVGSGTVSEKQYHDQVLQQNEMPVELLRALLQNRPLTPEHKSTWKFYEKL